MRGITTVTSTVHSVSEALSTLTYLNLCSVNIPFFIYMYRQRQATWNIQHFTMQICLTSAEFCTSCTACTSKVLLVSTCVHMLQTGLGVYMPVAHHVLGCIMSNCNLQKPLDFTVCHAVYFVFASTSTSQASSWQILPEAGTVSPCARSMKAKLTRASLGIAATLCHLHHLRLCSEVCTQCHGCCLQEPCIYAHLSKTILAKIRCMQVIYTFRTVCWS